MKFTACERSKQGTGASRRLRKSGKTPGIVYGGSGEPKLIGKRPPVASRPCGLAGFFKSGPHWSRWTPEGEIYAIRRF